MPAWVAFEREKDIDRGEKPTSAADIKRALTVKVDDDVKAGDATRGPDREMSAHALRCEGPHRGRPRTTRNLNALALIWRGFFVGHGTGLDAPWPLPSTNTAWHGTRMRRF